jgi:hypothetical protein
MAVDSEMKMPSSSSSTGTTLDGFLGQERRLLMLGRDEVDRDPFDLGFEPLRGDDGTHTDRVWETLAIIDFHSNLLQSGIYVSSGRTDAGPGPGRCRPHCRTAFFLSSSTAPTRLRDAALAVRPTRSGDRGLKHAARACRP